MSADVLREAARLMRERAESAVCPCGGPACIMDNAGVRHDEMTARFDGSTRVVDHYVGMTPAVALAVADWLQSVSVDVDKRDNPERVGGRYEALRIPDERAALAVARAYLNP